MSLAQEQQFWSNRLHDDLRLQRLQLPSLPDITQRLRETLADPQVSWRTLAPAIAAEPVLTAKVMQTAGAAWTGLEPPSTLEQALARLGLHAVRGLVYNFCLAKLFRDRQTGPLRDELRKIWARSTQIAACAQWLAGKLALENCHAMLGGLVHNIGALPILALFAQQRELAGRLDLLKLLLEHDQGPVGEAVLRAWKMPADVVAVPVGLGSEGRDGEPSTIDVVRLALILDKWLATPDSTVPAIDAMPAARRLQLSRQRLEPWLLVARKELAVLTQQLQN